LIVKKKIYRVSLYLVILMSLYIEIPNSEIKYLSLRIIRNQKRDSLIKPFTMKRQNYAFTLLLVLLFICNTSNGQPKNSQDNTLTEKEVKEGWKLLFDGKSDNGWINAKTKKFPEGGWEIKDGMLSTNPETKGTSGGGDIVTVDKYRNFELIVDFLYTPGANSGIKYFVDTEKNNGTLASIGCEYQVLDDKLHPDAKLGIAGNRTLAGLYDLIAPVNVRDNGADQWNRATIIVKGNKVQHWLNGQMTVEYERGNQAWKDLVATSKFRTSPGFGEVIDGRILLQEHGNAVSFRNIKIREIE